jgi:hypothetical protein
MKSAFCALDFMTLERLMMNLRITANAAGQNPKTESAGPFSSEIIHFDMRDGLLLVNDEYH